MPTQQVWVAPFAVIWRKGIGVKAEKGLCHWQIYDRFFDKKREGINLDVRQREPALGYELLNYKPVNPSMSYNLNKREYYRRNQHQIWCV